MLPRNDLDRIQITFARAWSAGAGPGDGWERRLMKWPASL